MTLARLLSGATAALALFALPGWSHEARPVSLEITELGQGEYHVELRVPGSVESFNHPVVRWPAGCRESSTGRVHCEQVLAGQTFSLDWPLYNPSVTTLVRYIAGGASARTAVLPPDVPAWTVPAEPSAGDVMRSYFRLGVQHILGGWDHLLFVTGLLLIARGWRALLLAVSGFTLAHSLTLSLAALGFVHVPIPPTEAVIALSILFLAREALQPPDQSIAQRYPLLVSALFGLLHGLGFASALAEVGLPGREIAIALLFFNVGVEAGQLAFITTVLGAMLFLHRGAAKLSMDLPRWRVTARTGMAYLMGIPAAYWLVQRLPL